MADHGQLLAYDAKTLEQAGADGILLATNTMHKVAHKIQSAISIPFLHLLQATALQLSTHGITKVGLLGTRFTMSDGFYQAYMADFGIDVITPNADTQDEIHRIIFDELCLA
ncbi:amino acid racemase [Moraxella nasovis]|uniref:aspartate/glutamate racemase family protein n=1 Tax=Moraxella nasovis TaxID=2904121 RepID=UPI001F60DEC2|nr:amino acid racemase [Moraxella nasovis]UNU72727.1 amino acid racemase [Moraxella nasovis]